MSEKIYAWLLRLYPSHFRESYGDAAMQLLRDRSRHERGFLPTLHLWLDLLADLAISVPRQHRYVRPALIGASVHQCSDGTPSFHVLEGGSPRPGALLLGGLLSLGAVMASIPIGYLANHHPLSAAFTPWSTLSRPEQQATRGAEEKILGSVQPAIAANHLTSSSAKPSDYQSKVEGGKLDAVERQRVIRGVIANLKQYYIDSDLAQKMADALLAHEKSGHYNTVTDGAALADLLSKQLRVVSHDMHLEVVYSQVPLAEHRLGPTPEGLARYRKAMEEDNCTFKKVEILPHNIGYLKLNSFPDPSICQQTARAAMASLNHADAIIFDLRDNGGGDPSMVMLIAAYLFDHPEYMYNPRENTTERSWTRSPVPGNRLADKPVYVLTSSKTQSGAEHFSYDLKMLKRATIVGETTRGNSHAGSWHRIDSHFGMGIPETRPINPFSKSDWEGTGVEPDVKVKAAEALERAEKLAESKLRAAR